MHIRWKLLGGAGLAGIGLVFVILGHSRVSRGDTAADSTATSNATANDPTFHDPGAPFELGPGAISFDQARADLKADVDDLQQREDLGQPPQSYQAFSAAAAWAAANAQIEIAAQSVGLDTNTLEQGVVP